VVGDKIQLVIEVEASLKTSSADAAAPRRHPRQHGRALRLGRVTGSRITGAVPHAAG
jgi:hypothetical protein